MDDYHSPVQKKRPFQWLIVLALFIGLFMPTASAFAVRPQAHPNAPAGISASELILAMNTLRVSTYGNPPLIEDPIIDAVAQATAETMAANEMSWHIGNVSGRLAAGGYGGGATVWATENFAMGTFDSIDQIMVIWSDASHQLPADTPAYCNVGAGVALSPNGMTYYVLQAAYTDSKSCGAYTSPTSASGSGSGTGSTYVAPVSQVIIPVKVATPDSDGKIYHIVQAGQTFWAIAIAYKITIKDLETWNNISSTTPLQVGQKLFIPSGTTAGYATPTPVGLVQVSTPDATGKVVHIVEAYQTLSTIAQAYGVDVNTLLTLNGITVDTPLQIGEKLVIRPASATATFTPLPLTPLEMLTPASDGKYYHIVKSGETLSGIARLYGVAVADLMAWNGLNASSVLQVNQKLLLQVTPPPSKTPTLSPPTNTPTVTLVPPISTNTPFPTLTAGSSTSAPTPGPSSQNSPPLIFISIGVVAAGLFLAVIFVRRKPNQK